MNNKKTILMIDDEKDFVNIMTLQLENSGYKVITAFSGQEGWEKMNNENVDLILLDLLLPDIHGCELYKKIRANKKTEKTPVIVISGARTKYAMQKFPGCCKYAFIDKPFEFKDLLAKIESLLS